MPIIPKKINVEKVKDFHPISLVGEFHKILSKVLANRLSLVLGELISKTQNAFVKGRQILGVMLMANECLLNSLKLGELWLLCKLNMENAYEHVNWDFLLYLLERCSFGMKWCTWIYHCIFLCCVSLFWWMVCLKVFLRVLEVWDKVTFYHLSLFSWWKFWAKWSSILGSYVASLWESQGLAQFLLLTSYLLIIL